MTIIRNKLAQLLENQLHWILLTQQSAQRDTLTQLSNQLHDQLYWQLHNQLDNQLYRQLDDQLLNQLCSQLDNQLQNKLS